MLASLTLPSEAIVNKSPQVSKMYRTEEMSVSVCAITRRSGSNKTNDDALNMASAVLPPKRRVIVSGSAPLLVDGGHDSAT